MPRINKVNKATPVAADEILIYDSEDTGDDKSVTLAQIKTFSATDISGKQNLITSPTNNHVVTTDASGQTKDSTIASTDLTTQGNTFNGNSQLVQLDSSGKLPAVNGSLLTGVGGGVVNFSDSVIIDANFTLAVDTITYGHVSGNYTLTLPTITDFTKQKECIFDFTTVNASYPSITNTNIDKKDGKPIVPSASLSGAKTVTGASNTNPIVITCAGHGYQTGDTAVQASLGGTNTNANGTFYPITVVGADYYSIPVAGNGTYTSGGTSQKYVTRNRLIFKSIIGKNRWEVELQQFGGILTPYNQPNISANGTLGGAVDLAVSASTEYSGTYPAWKAFDSNSGTYWASADTGSPISITHYSQNAIKLDSFTITNMPAGYSPTAGSVYGSNDGTNWIYITNFTNGIVDGGTWTLVVSSTNFFKYHKIVTSALKAGAVRWECQQITANGNYMLF